MSGDGSERCGVDIQPVTGRIDPGQSEPVVVSVSWNKTVRYMYMHFKRKKSALSSP